MYKRKIKYGTLVKGNPVKDGEPIEHKVARLTKNKEPIKDGAPEIFTERKDGVKAAYNIRTDRWELATEAMDKIYASKMAKRDNIVKPTDESDEEKGKVIDINKDSEAESTHGKADKK